MPIWLQYLAAAGALVVLAPVLAWAAKRFAPRSTGLALLLLGLGAAIDPPRRHVIEAMEEEEDQSPQPGDPPTT